MRQLGRRRPARVGGRLLTGFDLGQLPPLPPPSPVLTGNPGSYPPRRAASPVLRSQASQAGRRQLTDMKIVTVIGARPQLIKAAAVSRAIARCNRGEIPGGHVKAPAVIQEILVHTGQHYDDGLSGIFFRELEIPEPAYYLGVGSGSHGWQTGKMLAGIEEVLTREQPHRVLVYGDTNSTLAGALAAAKTHIPVAHVEAGLRSYNRAMPEEVNRVLTDHLSDLLFCPSQTAVDNLAMEGITRGVHRVGDVMFEALMFVASHAQNGSTILKRLGLQPKQFLLATVHRAENTDDPDRLANIMRALIEVAQREAVVLALHPRTRQKLQDHGLVNFQTPADLLRIIDPVGYFDMVALEQFSRLILTDSGGMQKEAYWLGVPCITMRDETEWVETVASGWNVIVGAETWRIVEQVSTFRPTAERAPLYGDQGTPEEIIRLLLTPQSDHEF